MKFWNCSNEEESIAKVLTDIPGYVDQLIVADNGSTDKTVEIAKSLGATTVFEPVTGYGSAFQPVYYYLFQILTLRKIWLLTKKYLKKCNKKTGHSPITGFFLPDFPILRIPTSH